MRKVDCSCAKACNAKVKGNVATGMKCMPQPEPPEHKKEEPEIQHPLTVVVLGK